MLRSMLSTDIHVKSTDVHQYLEYSSCHPAKYKQGIPFLQAKRYRRIIPEDEKYLSSLNNLKRYFQNRHYPEDVVRSAFYTAATPTQEEALN